MATAILNDTRLTVTFDAGIDLDGNTIYKRKSFNNVKSSATHDQLYNIVQALAPLQVHPVTQIERTNAFDLSA